MNKAVRYKGISFSGEQGEFVYRLIQERNALREGIERIIGEPGPTTDLKEALQILLSDVGVPKVLKDTSEGQS